MRRLMFRKRSCQGEPNIMRTAFSFMLLVLTLGVVTTATADPLEEITRTIHGKARRASSPRELFL